jgi:general secretion pathway protein G
MDNRHRRRNGFTLIELLVVIAIIGILVGLTTAAVVQYLNKIPVVNTTSDIRQLASALENFKTKFGFYPPSRIRLCRTLAQYTNAQKQGSLDQVSLAYTNAMFPRISWANGIDWSNGLQPAFQQVVLEGDQCLVFFLGGIPNVSPPGCQGFSTDPLHPANPKTVQQSTRIGPFFEFPDSTRMIQAHSSDANNPNAFFSYADAYGGRMPYAYLSSGKTAGGYNMFYSDPTYPPLRGKSDCNLLGVWPYAEFMATSTGDQRPPRYLNPNSFQIISAGKDLKYGTGTPIQNMTATAIITLPVSPLWSLGNPTAMGALNNYYQDDQSNFSDRLLGIGG